MSDRNEQRVLARRNARELTQEEVSTVSAGLTKCVFLTFPHRVDFDIDP